MAGIEHIYREQFRNDLSFIAREVKNDPSVVNLSGAIGLLVTQVKDATDPGQKVEELLEQFWRKSPETYPFVLESLSKLKKQIDQNFALKQRKENWDVFDDIAEEFKNNPF